MNTGLKAQVGAPDGRADWRRVRELYSQLSDIINDPEKSNTPSDELTGSLAEGLSRVLAHYDGEEIQFVEDVFHIFSVIDKFGGSPAARFRRLYFDERLERISAYNPQGHERRRPKPFEAAVETCRRLRDLNKVRDALADRPTAGILGGSVSYGRFFNVCGAQSSGGKASDSDLLLVLPDYHILPEVAKLLTTVQGIDRKSLDEFRRRIKIFPKIRRSRRPCIISHKFQLWEERSDPYLSRYQLSGMYLLSLHVFSLADFEFMIVKDLPIFEPASKSKFERAIWDYRNTPPERNDNQRDFSGRDLTVELVRKDAEEGFLSHVRVCHIENDRFYPGLHQNLVLPQFEIRWESALLRVFLHVIGFRWKILERLRYEQQRRPYELQRLSLSHTRSAIFSPHVQRRADRY